jgi:hypothetical protein
MDKSKHTFSLGEKEITLSFNWGGIKRLKNLLNADPLVEFTKLKETTDLVDFSVNVIAACGEMNKDEVVKIVDNLLPHEAINLGTEILTAFNNAFKIDEAGGETSANTQREEAA